MMGRMLLDPDGTESNVPELQGLDIFPIQTTFTSEKKTEQVTGRVVTGFGVMGMMLEGYEIHMGRTIILENENVIHPFLIRLHQLADTPDSYHFDGVMSPDGLVWGTYIHAVLHNDELRHAWLNEARREKGIPIPEEAVCYNSLRESSFDRLADHVRQHVNMELLYQIIDR